VAERVDATVANLAVRGHARPRKVKTLLNTINSLFMKTLGESELSALVEELRKRGYIVVENDHVSYKLPSAKP
jgi:hypothetical protein